MKSYSAVFAAALLGLSAQSPVIEARAETVWLSSLDEATLQARKTGKALLAAFR